MQELKNFVQSVQELVDVLPQPNQTIYWFAGRQLNEVRKQLDFVTTELISPMEQIQELMNGVEWSPATLDQIADILNQAGYPVDDCDG